MRQPATARGQLKPRTLRPRPPVTSRVVEPHSTAHPPYPPPPPDGGVSRLSLLPPLQPAMTTEDFDEFSASIRQLYRVIEVLSTASTVAAQCGWQTCDAHLKHLLGAANHVLPTTQRPVPFLLLCMAANQFASFVSDLSNVNVARPNGTLTKSSSRTSTCPPSRGRSGPTRRRPGSPSPSSGFGVSSAVYSPLASARTLTADAHWPCGGMSQVMSQEPTAAPSDSRS